MEEKNKKVFSTILLSVGVLFIVVSGGIFVSKTWNYLTDGMKLFGFAVVTAGFFGGSYYLEKRSLHKASAALYYLGICFTGFSAALFCKLAGIESGWERLLCLLALSVPTTLRFLREQKVIDLILQIFLCDGMILSVSDLDVFGMGDKTSLLCFATFTMALSALIYYCRVALREEKGLLVTTEIALALHGLIGLPWTFINLLADDTFFFGLYPVLMLLAAVTALYLAFEKNIYFRILQSIMLAYAALGVSLFLFRNAMPDFGFPEFASAFFGAYVIMAILMAALDRKELCIGNGFMAFFISLLQISEYASMGADLKRELLCHPYGICFGITLLAWKYLHQPKTSWKTTCKVALLFGTMNLNVIFSYVGETYGMRYGLVLGFCLLALIFSACFEGMRDMEMPRRAMQTAALCFAVLAVLVNPIFEATFYASDGVTLLADFRTEYHVIFMGLGIVLLGIIWYDMFERIRFFQFIGTCLLLATLVIRNLSVPALPNVLFLGLGALAMLIVATILKQKGYALLAAVTLILVALYLTKEVWMSIAWWVYLFVAGVGLVIFAIKKEKAE